MKLATFRSSFQNSRVGVVLSLSGRDLMVDLTRAYAVYLDQVEREPHAQAVAEAVVPNDMRMLLEGGDKSMKAAANAARFAAETLATAAVQDRWKSAALAHELSDVTFLPPIPRCGKIISVGANYEGHLAEVEGEGKDVLLPQYGAKLREANYPVAFSKFPSTMVGHNQPIIHPRWTTQLDYEAEFSVVIGKRCKNVPAERYLDVIAGYTIVNDISMRDIGVMEQERRLLLMGKNLDTTAPMGPYLVTKDEIADPHKVQIRLWVNGDLRQNDNTANMIFKLGDIIAYYSRMTLEPGDIITTGSPAGVAFVRKPPEPFFLKPGDVVEIEMEGLGRLRNPIVAEDEAA